MPKSSRSIRQRLALAALVTLLGAMSAAGIALLKLFEHHVERHVVAGLEADIGQLLAGFSVAPDGSVRLARRPVDPRYDQPFSGVYWQVEAKGAIAERSRSLWDEKLALPQDDPSPGTHEHIVPGPRGRSLIVVERAIRVEREEGQLVVRFAAAHDRAETISDVRNFGSELAVMLLVLGALLLLAFIFAVGIGLAPLARLRGDLTRLRSGDLARLTGNYPSEVALIVADLNALLDQRTKAAERSRQRAADLAHGLKTPITAISGICEELASQGEAELSAELSRYASSMHHHVERELARARSIEAGAVAAPTPLAPVAGMLVESLKRLPRGGGLIWMIDVGDVAVAADETALAEILGNLLDNARKWAASRVRIRAHRQDGEVKIEVSDDGPGVDAQSLPELTGRGRRLDLSKAGTGLGLSIVHDIVEELGGRLELAAPQSGGLTATVSLPSRSSALSQ